MVASIGALRNRQASEFTSPDHDGRIQKSSLLQIFHQCRRGLIGASTQAFQTFGIATMSIPWLTTHIDPDKSHALLDKLASGQAAGSVFFDGWIIKPVEFSRFLRLT